MKLSARDLSIISVAQMYAERQIGELAEAVGEKEHVVRRVISAALRDGVLRRRVLVNLRELGFQEYGVFFSAGVKTAAQRNRFREVLLKAPHALLLLEVGGRFNFGAVILAPTATQLENFFDYIVSESKVPVTDLQLQVRNGWYFFGAKYLSEGVKQEPVHLLPSGKAIELSPEDGKVLHVFANSPGGVLSRMARQAGMAVATFAYRLERIRKLGIIAGVRYQVIPEMVGHAPYRALVMTSLPLTAPRVRIMEWASQNPYVVTMMHGVGLWQYELRIEAPNYATASAVVDELTERFSSVIQSVELMPVLKVLKMELHPNHVLSNQARDARAGVTPRNKHFRED